MKTWRIAAAILFAAAVLRLPMLDRRPMHADEAILADKFGTLLSTGAYPYDPHEYHGPVLAWAAWIPAHLTGRTTYASLTETTIRVVPAVCGIVLAMTPLLLMPAIGAPAALAASAFVAVSPAMVYYSRDFIPEIPLVLWTALLLAAVLRGGRWWVAGAPAAALMLATKETALVALASAAIAYAVAFRRRWIGMAAAGVCVLAAWKSPYFARGISGGIHGHPVYQYLAWFWTEAPIVLLALAGWIGAWRSGKPGQRFIAIYSVVLLAAYSAIPYKTPWCVLSPLYGLAVVAGIAAQRFDVRAIGAVALILGVVAWLGATRFATDTRNPWVYAQTGPGVFEIRDRVLNLGGPVDVYTAENWWPLPWYFRSLQNVRWWRVVDPHGAAAPVVLVSPALEPALTRKLYEGPPPGQRELYMNLFPNYTELRPGTEVRGYAAKRLWDLLADERK